MGKENNNTAPKQEQENNIQAKKSDTVRDGLNLFHDDPYHNIKFSNIVHGKEIGLNDLPGIGRKIEKKEAQQISPELKERLKKQYLENKGKENNSSFTEKANSDSRIGDELNEINDAIKDAGEAFKDVEKQKQKSRQKNRQKPISKDDDINR